MSKRKIIIMLCFVSLEVSGYKWPFPADTVRKINSTLGEPRGMRGSNPPYVRFHRGIDIDADSGEIVIAVDSGIVTKRGERYYSIGKFTYAHIKSVVIGIDTFSLEEGMFISANDTIGQIDAYNHLHFEELRGLRNPLRKGGLDGFVDSTPPVIAEGSIRFWRQGTDSMLNPNDLSGKVDITVCCKDFRVAPGGHIPRDSGMCGVYSLEYQILKSNSVIRRYKNVIFNTIPEKNLIDIDIKIIELNKSVIELGGVIC